MRAVLVEVPRAVAVVVLLELGPVAQLFQRPVLLEGQVRDAAARERAALGSGQAVQAVVGVFLIEAGGEGQIAGEAITRPVVGVGELIEGGGLGVVGPGLTGDAAEAVPAVGAVVAVIERTKPPESAAFVNTLRLAMQLTFLTAKHGQAA